MVKRKLLINSLYELTQGLALDQCNYYSSRCAVALESEQHEPGSLIKILGKETEDYELEWTTPNEINSLREPKKNVELGAVVISLLLAKELTEYSFITEACQGEGVDYWLGYPAGHEKYDEYNFAHARLEISGIKSESPTNNLEKRIKEKTKQSQKSDGTRTDAYISIVEFSTPKAFFNKK